MVDGGEDIGILYGLWAAVEDYNVEGGIRRCERGAA